MGGLTWRDDSSYAAHEVPGRTPWRVHTLDVYGLILSLCRDHAREQGKWVVYCPPMFPHHVLGTHRQLDEELAKAMAVQLVVNRLTSILDFLKVKPEPGQDPPDIFDQIDHEIEQGFDEVA